MAINHKYKPSEVKAISWEEIGHFYNDLISHNWPLQGIIPVIQCKKNDNMLSKKLFAFTSLDKLVISIYDPIELNREAVHIHYEKEKELWSFKYYASPYHKPEYERNYPGELLIEKFNNYLVVLKRR